MCPSVWLTLDVLASRRQENSQAPTTAAAAGTPILAQYIGSWLDKLKANRENGQSDEYSSNVQFALELTPAVTQAQPQVDQKEVKIYQDGKEVLIVPNNKKRKKKKKGKTGGVRESEETGIGDLMEELKPLVDCSFDLPKSSQVGCQRLMGTNVVRLTDKSFMQELRRRIKEDYNAVLQKRIAVRESKEMERERTLAISSRTGCIPQTLAGKPVNLMSKNASGLAKSRAKLKTNRERNAERLVRQGIKWERERLISYELEKKKLLEAQKRREEELMIDRTEELNSKGQYLKRNATNLPKTQIEDSPATDNKLESIVDVPGGAEEEEEEDQETDEDESDDLIHDDAEAPDHEKEEVEEEDKLKTSKSGDSAEVGGEVKINQSATGTTIYLASGESAASLGNPFQGQTAVHAIVLTGDEIMERLMAAETVDELYRVAEEIIGKTKTKRMKNLLST